MHARKLSRCHAIMLSSHSLDIWVVGCGVPAVEADGQQPLHHAVGPQGVPDRLLRVGRPHERLIFLCGVEGWGGLCFISVIAGAVTVLLPLGMQVAGTAG